MAIPILTFTVGAEGSPERVELDVDAKTVDGLKQQTIATGPTALVVRIRDGDAFRALKTLVIDRGDKARARELARRLLGQRRVPLIVGSYTSAGQLCRSVRALLDRATRRGDLNLFVVAVADSVFERLWLDARRPSPDTVVGARAIIDLLPPAEVPADLARKYLGASDDAQLVRRLILRAAAVEDPVLIIGDTGTGKEVVARAIHDYGRRRVEMFVSVNCAAIPQDLFESELFGHEPGSFTGASHRKPGLWALAHRGTLFLDEIGDLRADHQAKILRALQENRIRPVGATDEIAISARVLAATNRDLSALVRAGSFREDLYYRLRSFFIPTSPLSRHPADVPLLAQAFWKTITRDPDATLGDAVIDALVERSWPGNARELRAVLSNLYGLFGRSSLGSEHLEAVTRLQAGGFTARRAASALARPTTTPARSGNRYPR